MLNSLSGSERIPFCAVASKLRINHVDRLIDSHCGVLAPDVDASRTDSWEKATDLTQPL
jgi:hypothetical protein